MPGSKKVATIPTAPQFKSPPRPWDEYPIPGPQGLYTAFAWGVLDDTLPEIKKLDDETYALFQKAIDRAIQTVCIAAQISPTWDGLYMQVAQQINLSKREG